VKKATAELLEIVKETPESFFINRDEGNYDLFLDLYQQVGYAPSAPDDLAKWKERSRKTWRLQDSLLPGSHTGGWVEGEIVSAAGTLPRAKNILYGHSFCMVKTLDAAVTLFVQSLHSIDAMEAFPEISYWAGSYNYRSHFTSQFQRPAGAPIANQLELEAVRLLEPDRGTRCTKPLFTTEAITPDGVNWMIPLHREFFRELSTSNLSLAPIHRVATRALREGSTGVLKGAAITQSVPPEFTASNVFSCTWVFPAPDVVIDPDFIRAVRSVPEIGHTGLQIVLQTRGKFSLDKLDERVIPNFWALTPRSQLGALRGSIETAFAALLDRYPEEQLKRHAGQAVRK
jgi:hypothetical protein